LEFNKQQRSVNRKRKVNRKAIAKNTAEWWVLAGKKKRGIESATSPQQQQQIQTNKLTFDPRPSFLLLSTSGAPSNCN